MNYSHKLNIAQKEQVIKRVQELSRRSDDIKSRIAVTLKKLWVSERSLASVTNLDAFNILKAQFPNFIEVIELYESNAIGLRKLNLPFEAPPILLVGEPGLGKTYFVSELAKLISLPFFEISLASSTTSFALIGGNLQWSEGSSGFIANSLAESEVANPIFLIDEIDKNEGGHKYNPMNAFYTLLESHSAKRFRDEALEIELDASRVIWIATANYVENIPEPILSRMQIFEIRNPDPVQMAIVVKNIYLIIKKTKSYGELLSHHLDEQIIDYFQTSSPREVKRAIEQACLKAIREDRTELEINDFQEKQKGGHRVGFI